MPAKSSYQLAIQSRLEQIRVELSIAKLRVDSLLIEEACILKVIDDVELTKKDPLE